MKDARRLWSLLHIRSSAFWIRNRFSLGGTNSALTSKTAAEPIFVNGTLQSGSLVPR